MNTFRFLEGMPAGEAVNLASFCTAMQLSVPFAPQKVGVRKRPDFAFEKAHPPDDASVSIIVNNLDVIFARPNIGKRKIAVSANDTAT